MLGHQYHLVRVCVCVIEEAEAHCPNVQEGMGILQGQFTEPLLTHT